ncbi:MAG: hypothetical protein GY850_27535 [bacterium]|nr:hypothetical protein [bacterium]
MEKDIRQKLSVQSAAAIEKLCRDIVVLNNFIVKELDTVENNSNFDEKRKKAARRGVFEQATRKLEVIKGQSQYTKTGELLEMKLKLKAMEEETALLQFLREKEVRDRIYGMSETQILSLFGESLFDGSNALLLNAIINAPEGFEPISKRTLKKIQQAAGAGKIDAESDKDIESVRDLNSVVAEIFSLVKKELDNLRRQELPSSLTQSNESRERPFKF